MNLKRRNPIACFQSKTGNAIIDSILVIAVLVMLIIVIPVLYGAFSELQPELRSDFVAKNDTVAVEILDNSFNSYPSVFDGVVGFVFIGMILAAVISSYVLETHPLFFVITIILLIAVCVVAIYLGNGYEELMQDEDLASYTASFPISYWIGTHLLEIAIGIGFLIAIVLFAKRRSE